MWTAQQLRFYRVCIAFALANIAGVCDIIAMKQIAFTAAALKSLRKLPKAARLAILAKVEAYAETGAGNTKALVGRPGVRLRSGDYRALFIETADAIEVFAVGNRRDIYD
ncbi:hypothetical protein AOPFMNJM_3945 [Methylobacterium jeotgali]|uniref:Plasmid stabilization protein n=3 Tax=Pseudomonadota TaxID=1224 RepID=A0ABQ4T0H9_9HYPH|nr:hypothetical protein AwMethylo_35850 [Methylobacterium sp.]GJE08602.1 hypothetical protein AOPFMNJM_3945 [Methylobacterium jeotgali]